MADLEDRYHQLPLDGVDSQPVNSRRLRFTVGVALISGSCLALLSVVASNTSTAKAVNLQSWGISAPAPEAKVTPSWSQSQTTEAPAVGVENAEKFVADAMKTEGIVVFAKTYWPDAKKCLSVLTDENAEMTVHHLDTLGEPKNGPVQQELEKITGIMSVPQVFVKGKFIGNGQTIDDLKAAGTLRTKMEEAGATFKPACGGC